MSGFDPDISFIVAAVIVWVIMLVVLIWRPI